MKALLTGITGNVGSETARALHGRGVELVSHIRAGNEELLRSFGMPFAEVATGDLLEGLSYAGDVDCIVHTAGIVHFREAGNKNEEMMRNVIMYAAARTLPVHFVSTAFVYRPESVPLAFTNRYEADKHAAEELLRVSGIPHSILRPSVITGNTHTGELRSYTGYYLIVKAFLGAALAAKNAARKLRFPKMHGMSDVVPVDQAAAHIAEVVTGARFETLFITNPEPPAAAWMLSETLRVFGLTDIVDILDMPFEEFGTLALTEEEAMLYQYGKHFSAYWSMTYRFPDSICTENRVDRAYLERTLAAFARTLPAHG